MSEIRSDLQYTKDHEYLRASEQDGVYYVGITDYAQGELGDVVYVELPQVGRTLDAHETFGTIEAVKAVSELYSPAAGEVVEVNGRLDAEPALVNTDPYGDGWMIKLRLTGDRSELLDAAAYGSLIGQ